MIPTTAEDGISTIAFALKHAVDGYGAKVAEIAMDSTCKPPVDTKTHETDCYLREDKRRWVWAIWCDSGRLMAKHHPLGFMFTAMTEGQQRRVQTVYARGSPTWFKARCPHIKFTLSNKDPSEINVFRLVIVQAKHQLCCWRAERYIEEHLKEDKPPTWYNPIYAHTIFSFIDPTWALV